MKKQKAASNDSDTARAKAPAARLLVIHGPNLNLLGTREPQHYGAATLADINRALARRAEAAGVELETFQSNHEGALIERIHAARGEGVRYIVINPAAFSYAGYAVLDALKAVDCPVIEVHLSNIHARDESWRANSILSSVVNGVIAGLGAEGYALAVRWIVAKAR